MAKLKELSVTFLSLVATPATGKGLTLKAKEGQRAQVFEIAKADDERMVAYGIVYAPDQEDAHGDTADAETIRKACYEFMREGRLKNIDTEHSFTTEMAFVCESWLVRKGDELFPKEPEGAWAVGIRVGDPDLWNKLKSGELTGISLAGIARVDPDPDETPDAQFVGKQAPGWFTSWIKSLTGQEPPKPIEETEMTKEEVTALVAETLKSALPDALKEAGMAAPPAKEEPTEVEKAVAAALKAAGIEPKEKAEDDEGDDGAIAKAVEAAVAKAVGPKVEAAIAKAVAKGVTEADPSAQAEESFL